MELCRTPCKDRETRHQTFAPVHCRSHLIQKLQKIRRTGPSLPEAMLRIQYQAVIVQMFYYRIPDNRFHHLRQLAGKTDRSLVHWLISAALLEYRCDIGCSPAGHNLPRATA